MAQVLSPFGVAVSGSLAACYALISIYPLDLIKTRIQVQSKHNVDPEQHYKSTLDALIKIIQKEGPLALYNGLGGGLLYTVLSNFSYFYTYGFVRSKYLKRFPGEIGIAMELALGAVAGALSQIITLPIAVVNTRQLTSSKDERKDFIGTWVQVVKEEGIEGLWRGLGPALILCVNPAITYGLHSRMKTAVNQRAGREADARLSGSETFVIGAIAKTLATIVSYPYILAKIRLQWRPKPVEGAQAGVTYKSTFDVLKKVLESDGITGWYRGMGAQIYKAVLQQALLFLSKDEFEFFTLMVFTFIATKIKALRQVSNHKK
ncbi:hypothetical protein SmJEL517_g02613 [Synchytrium microbalum]|uniref:ADP,ATP carrier protein n=1 Tax=Synchytrium microbalum TaxID=1806994 RepID=A0A507C675_9FUNG|nr:uncharacterized protein SmJEL517_g02613 [Synchytrium microbalum]TPX34848.1 hypothetical protein SmJEL517_g02613 [Synchytrium microbalum]